MKFKMDHSFLLAMALQELNMTREKFEAMCHKKLDLKSATETSIVRETFHKCLPGTDEPLYADYKIWTTSKYNIKATNYGRIKAVEKIQPLAPKVIIKKKRTFNK